MYHARSFRAFRGIFEVAIPFCVVARAERPERPRSDSEFPINDSIWDLIQRCWAQNPDDRCTMENVYESLTAIHHNRD